MRIVLATGETDICLAENRRLSSIMAAKGITHELDVWGDGAGHDWPWWEQMAVKFLLTRCRASIQHRDLAPTSFAQD